MVLILSFAATGIAWYGLKTQAEGNAAAEFEDGARQIAGKIDARMRAYEEAVQAVVALFAASDAVTRDDWRRFVDRLDLSRDYPGIDVLGFAKHLGMQQLGAHELDMRAQGLPDYRVWPEGSRDEYLAVTFIEPLDGEARSMLGYDMLANPTSRSAMEQARRMGASLSGRWTVGQDARPESQATILMFAPLFPGENSDIADAGALVGYVYAD